MPKEIDTEPVSHQEVPISDDPSSKDLPPESHSAGHRPYGVDTIVIPFTWSGQQRRRLPWRQFGGNKWVTGPYPPNHVGQSGIKTDQQLATELKDVRQTNTDFALSALYPNGWGTAAAAGASAPSTKAVRIKATADAGLSGGSGATVGLGTLTLSHTSRLGDLSMPYETGYSQGHEGKAAGVVSSGARDHGGVSYGAHQFASSGAGGRQVQAFLRSPKGAR